MNLVDRERTREAAEMSEKTMTTSSGVKEVTLLSFAARAGSIFSSRTVLTCPLACTDVTAGPSPVTIIAVRTSKLKLIRRTYLKLFFITLLRKIDLWRGVTRCLSYICIPEAKKIHTKELPGIASRKPGRSER